MNKQLLFMVLVAVGGFLLIRRILTPNADIQAHFEEQDQLQQIKSIAAKVNRVNEQPFATIGNTTHIAMRTDPISATSLQIPQALQFGVKQWQTVVAPLFGAN